MTRCLPVLLGVLLAGCSAVRWDGPEPAETPPQARDMSRSERGNPPFYEVYGVRYRVLEDSAGYRERGVASWYGRKFHGRPTSSGETYDMHRMTAAHKSLPLPTNVRVTNLANGRSVVVRVNDRGPFVKNRLIDLSYAAARELDMIGAGTALVEVEAIDTGYTGRIATMAAAPPAPAAGKPRRASSPRMYLQVGAFGESDNAQNLATRLADSGVSRVEVHAPAEGAPALYRVRIGPFDSVSEYDRVLAQIETLQISETHLVVEPARP